MIEVPREVLGMPDIPPIVLAGGTYARSLPNAVSFGVTVPDRVRLFGFEKGGAHQADEYGDIPNLMRSIKVYVRALIEIDVLWRRYKQLLKKCPVFHGNTGHFV